MFVVDLAFLLASSASAEAPGPSPNLEVRRVGDAKHHEYARPANDGGDPTATHVVHVAEPDLRVGAPSAEDAAALARAYANMLREYAAALARRAPRTLRLLPISGGIFTAAHSAHMAPMARTALARGVEALPDATRRSLASGADNDAGGACIEARACCRVDIGADAEWCETLASPSLLSAARRNVLLSHCRRSPL